MDFLRRARWKAYHRSSNRPNTGRYLDLLGCPTMVPESLNQRPAGRTNRNVLHATAPAFTTCLIHSQVFLPSPKLFVLTFGRSLLLMYNNEWEIKEYIFKKILPGAWILSLVSVVFCQVEVCATS